MDSCSPLTDAFNQAVRTDSDHEVLGEDGRAAEVRIRRNLLRENSRVEGLCRVEAANEPMDDIFRLKGSDSSKKLIVIGFIEENFEIAT